MEQTRTENNTARPKDRKLGDEWTDWNGCINPEELKIDEKHYTFLKLAALVIVMYIALLPMGLFMIKPRINEMIPALSNILEVSLIAAVFIFFSLLFIEFISISSFQRPLFPYKLTERFLILLLPKTLWLGERLGISKDKVGNSFIKVHNYVTKTHARNVNPDKVLILMPRCLKKDIKNQVMNRLDGFASRALTVSGGEEARKAIGKFHPSLILALACERDLMSGLNDIAHKVPVIAIPNKRPEGPCKNTHVLIEDVDEAMKFIKNEKPLKTGAL